MRGFTIFIGIAVLNCGLSIFTGIYGAILFDLSLIITLLILLLHYQKAILNKINRRKETREQKILLKQREEAGAVEELDENDLPTEKDIKENYQIKE